MKVMNPKTCFVPNIPLKNKFQALSSNLDGISTLSNSSTTANPSSQQLPKSPPIARSKLPIEATPRLQDKDQLALSFMNFLEDLKNDDGDIKYVKIAKEMIAYNRNELQIQIGDILKHNKLLGDQDYQWLLRNVQSYK